MITRVFFGARRPDLTTEACLAHWRGTHAAIGARLPAVRAYVQNHGVLSDGRFLLPYPGFDIMPELDWDDLGAMDVAIDSPIHEQDSIDDEANFIDTARTGYAVTTRHVLRDGDPPSGAVKLITLLRRGPNAPPRALDDALTGPYAAAVAPITPPRHEVLVTLPDREGRPAVSVPAGDILWFTQPPDALQWTRFDAPPPAAGPLPGGALRSRALVPRAH